LNGRPFWYAAMNDPFSQWRARRKKMEAQARRILGVKDGASLDELKKAYRGLARITHPDANPGGGDHDGASSHQRFINVKAAFMALAKGKDEPLDDSAEADEAVERMDSQEYMAWWVRKWGG